jgi:uncharacterized membrane protein HdeD (DUF308 family)
MSTIDTRPALPAGGLSTPPAWVRLLLGVVLLLAGLFVVADVVLASVVSAMIIGAFAIAGGAFEIVHAFWTKGWGGFIWQIVLGALYVAVGIVLVSQPVPGALIITYVLGMLLLLSGIVRFLLGLVHWQEMGWALLLSGAFGIIAGLIILTGFPWTGLWVLGALLGIDLIAHGLAWLIYAVWPSRRPATF